jgi:hypothetical protein
MIHISYIIEGKPCGRIPKECSQWKPQSKRATQRREYLRTTIHVQKNVLSPNKISGSGEG